jgi:hypothetical protein
MRIWLAWSAGSTPSVPVRVPPLTFEVELRSKPLQEFGDLARDFLLLMLVRAARKDQVYLPLSGSAAVDGAALGGPGWA